MAQSSQTAYCCRAHGGPWQPCTPQDAVWRWETAWLQSGQVRGMQGRPWLLARYVRGRAPPAHPQQRHLRLQHRHAARRRPATAQLGADLRHRALQSTRHGTKFVLNAAQTAGRPGWGGVSRGERLARLQGGGAGGGRVSILRCHPSRGTARLATSGIGRAARSKGALVPGRIAPPASLRAYHRLRHA